MSEWRVGLVFNHTRQWITVEAEDIFGAANRAPEAMAAKYAKERLGSITTPVVVVSAERRD